MRVLAICLSVALIGCSAAEQKVFTVVQEDLSVAIPRGESALGANDPLVICYKALDEVVKAQKAADEVGDGKLLDAVMKARILDQMRKKVGGTLQKACSEIAMEVMIQAASRGR